MRSIRSITRFLWQQARKRPLIAGGSAVALLLLLVLIISAARKPKTTETAYHTVKRGDFLISIVEGGTLKAVNEVTVRSELEGSAPIISIVKEGTFVKKGDLLVELDSSDLTERLTQQDITTQSSQFAYVQAKEALAIQKSVNDSNIKDAELKLDIAKDDLEKYRDGDTPQLRRTGQNDIMLAEEDLKRAQEHLDWTKKLSAKDFASKSEVETDELTVKRAQVKLDQAQESLRLMEKYDFPKTLRLRQSSVDQAQVELMRIKQRAHAQEAQAEAELESKQRSLEFNEKKLDHYKEQLEFTKITAPQDGMVIYSSSANSRSSYLIEEGATIRQKQDIIILPDISQMMLDVRVHESHVAQIKPGQRAYVTIDSVPDKRFRASVRKVALLPDSQSRYYNPNMKVYPTEIVIEDQLPDLKPGVSGRAEIVITNLPNVLTVPIQAVTSSRGQQVCFVKNGDQIDRVAVEVGMYNDKFIEVQKGLKEGDTVLLSALSTSDAMDLSGSIVRADEVDTNETQVAKEIREGTFNDGSGGKSSLDIVDPNKKKKEKKNSGDKPPKKSKPSKSGNGT